MAATAVALDAQFDWDVPQQVGLWTDAWHRFRRNRLAVGGLVVLAILLLDIPLSHLLPIIGVLPDPLTQDVTIIYAPPGTPGHLLGTDQLGRDTLSRLMSGAQISLSIGIIVQFIVLAVGGGIGLFAGYFGGRVDNLLMRFTDIWYAFPDLLFLLFIVSVLGPSFWTIFGAIGLIYWVGLARLVRGQVLSIKEKEYIEAATAVGSPPLKIMLKHLVPNSMGPVLVSLTFGIPNAIFLEAVLSYIGIGIQPPTASWGTMIHDGYEAIFTAPMLAIWPAIAIAMTMLAFTFIGDGLRDALDPRMRR
jgi:oligopeptide transport system permease protein